MNKKYMVLLLITIIMIKECDLHAGEGGNRKERFVHLALAKPTLSTLKANNLVIEELNKKFASIAGILCTARKFKILYKRDGSIVDTIILSQDVKLFAQPKDDEYYKSYNDPNKESLLMLQVAQTIVAGFSKEEFRSRDRFMSLISLKIKDISATKNTESLIESFDDDEWFTVTKKNT